MRLAGRAVWIAMAVTALASAQMKISGTLTCAKPDPMHSVDVGDSKAHSLTVMQNKCTWTKPIEIEGVQAKDDIGTGVSDARANMSHDQGYDVTTMANGDKLFVRNMGTSKMTPNGPGSMQGKWSFTGGTGKFKGIKGGGTFTGTGKPDGTAEINVEGEYTLGK